MVLEAKDSTNRGNYGSIAVRNEEVKEENSRSSQDYTSHRTSKFTLFVACFALLSCVVLVAYRHPDTSGTDISPQLVSENVEILGKVYRSPADTPRWFSQRRDHFEDFAYADTWQVCISCKFNLNHFVDYWTL